MNIQFWHSRIGDFTNDFYVPLQENFRKYHFLFPHEIWKQTPNSRETLKSQDVFLCEVSHPATGLWIELWFASIYWIRIICVYKKWSNISGSLEYVSDTIIEYTDTGDMIDKLKDIL